MSNKTKDLKIWEKCSPSPVAATDNSFFVESTGLNNQILFVTSNTSACLYSAGVDGWNILPSPALSGTFGPGSCGKFHKKSFTISPGSGSGGTWNDYQNGGVPGTVIKTSLTLLTNLRTFYPSNGSDPLQNTARIISGTGTGTSLVILANSTGPNSEIYVVDTSTNVVTLDATSVIEFYTGRFYVMNAGAVSAGSFRYFEIATQTWNNASVTNLPGTWATGGVLETSYYASFSAIASGSCNTPPSTTTVVNFTYLNTNLVVNSLVGCELRCTTGANTGQYRTITANSGQNITVSPGFTNAPTNNDNFVIGAHHDNMYLIGNGAVTMYLYNVATDTWSVITPSVARASAPGASPSLTWAVRSYTSNGDITSGLKMYSFRGDGSNNLDVYDIGSKTWSTLSYGRQLETFNTNSSWIFDKVGLIYCQINPVNATLPRFVTYSIADQSLQAYGNYPYAIGTPMNGCRMGIINYTIGVVTANTWLYYMPPSGTALYRVELY